MEVRPVTRYIGAKSDQRPSGASRVRRPSSTCKPGAATLQDLYLTFLAPVHGLSERVIEVINLMGADGKVSPEPVAPAHELVEALTATGNYLTAAIHILTVEPRPPGDILGAVLERSLTQFTRAVEAVRHLPAEILSIKPSRE
jgi:hypothetical protein